MNGLMSFIERSYERIESARSAPLALLQSESLRVRLELECGELSFDKKVMLCPWIRLVEILIPIVELGSQSCSLVIPFFSLRRLGFSRPFCGLLAVLISVVWSLVKASTSLLKIQRVTAQDVIFKSVCEIIKNPGSRLMEFNNTNLKRIHSHHSS